MDERLLQNLASEDPFTFDEAHKEVERLGPQAAFTVDALIAAYEKRGAVVFPNPPDPWGGYTDHAEPERIDQRDIRAAQALLAIGTAAFDAVYQRFLTTAPAGNIDLVAWLWFGTRNGVTREKLLEHLVQCPGWPLLSLEAMEHLTAVMRPVDDGILTRLVERLFDQHATTSAFIARILRTQAFPPSTERLPRPQVRSFNRHDASLALEAIWRGAPASAARDASVDARIKAILDVKHTLGEESKRVLFILRERPQWLDELTETLPFLIHDDRVLPELEKLVKPGFPSREKLAMAFRASPPFCTDKLTPTLRAALGL